MSTVQRVCQFMEAYAPRRLAEEWDNTGLLIGDRGRAVSSIMTCLTITPESVQEAIGEKADILVTHHPMPFRPVKRITADSTVGSLLLQLIESRIAVYSPHTSFDSARQGINHRLAEGLGIVEPVPLVPIEGDPENLGAGRMGRLAAPQSVDNFLQSTKSFLQIKGLHAVLGTRREVAKVAVACGSAGQFLAKAVQNGCDCFVTGETNFHTSLEAKAANVTLVLTGHFASERFALELLAESLATEFSDCRVWSSERECDPLTWR